MLLPDFRDCARHWAVPLVLSALLSTALQGRAAVTEAWVQRYSNVTSNTQNKAVKVVCDAAHNIIVTGTSVDSSSAADIVTIKYSSSGSVLWLARYNGPANRDDVPQALAVNASGDVAVAGYSLNTSAKKDYYTAKYAAANGALLWEKRYSGPRNNYATGVSMDTSGNVVVTGSSENLDGTTDYYTAKYAGGNGALLWEKRYDGPAHGYDDATALAVDPAGDVFVTGSSQNDFHTIKYRGTDGGVAWEKRYVGTNGFAGGWAITVDNYDEVIVTGTVRGSTTSQDIYTAKYAGGNGALLWEKFYSNPLLSGIDRGRALAADEFGNVVITGFSENGFPNFDTDIYTARYAGANGALLWEKRYDGAGHGDDLPLGVVMDGNGDAIVTGYSYEGQPGDLSDFYTAKYAAADGALLWEKHYNGPGNNVDAAQAVANDNGNIVVTGYDTDAVGNFGYYTAKYKGTDGALFFELRYSGSGQDDVAQAVAVDADGNVVVTGYSRNGNNNYDYYTAKYAAWTSLLLWERRYNGPANLDDYARAVAVDGSGNVFVTGSSRNALNDDYYTAKYAAADGSLLWENRYNGPANSYDYAQAVAVDGSGNAVVTGYSYGSSGYPDYYTAKYAAADGALLWEKRYANPATSHAVAQALALDSSGNVAVTGYVVNGPPNYDSDFYTAKYAAADGALLWEKKYDGPANDHDEGRAIAVDASGNVAVTGYSKNGAPNYDYDYYTAKYAAADGALLWEKRYNGPGDNFDYAEGVAMDGSGNVVVTGSSFGSGGGYDYYTAKYAAADGALIWGKRYDNPGNFDDFSQAVAADSSGNVVVTGYSYTGAGTTDYYTAKYAAADGALLWEANYNGPINDNDFVTTPHSLALGPDGMAAVTGRSVAIPGSSPVNAYATVLYREHLAPISSDLVPTGFRLRFPGAPGHSYKIERAFDLFGPWGPIVTVTAPSSGLIEYVDVDPLTAHAFYRLRVP